MKFALANIGCKVNRVEVDDAAARLLAQGAQLAGEGDADVVLVNTCTVTGEADKKTRKAVRQALRRHPQAQVLVTGCAAVMNPAWFRELDPRVRVVAKPQLVDAAWEVVGETPAQEPAAAPLRVGAEFRTRVGIKAQDGCNNACTFCTVHVARGASRSLPAADVLDEARRQYAAGAREIVLTGINLGAYAFEGCDLAGLLERLLDACPAARLRIGSIEPRDVSARLIELMARSGGRICRHLHLPLQSGSARVLQEMARPYDDAFYLGLVGRLRDAMPELSLSTDIIVGFPGETDADFSATLAVARSCAFSKIHVFRYSKRAGTPAAARPDQVPAEIVAVRAQRLQELGRALQLEDATRRLGTSERVLVEAQGKGTSESYHPVRLANSHAAVGELVRVCLTECDKDGMFIA